MNKLYRPYILAVFTSVAIISHHAVQAPNAFAGGFDNSGIPASESLMPDGKKQKVQPPLNFDWKRWSKPYIQSTNVCREYQGNIVCFTPQVAQQMGWLLQVSPQISQKSFSQVE